MSSCWLILTWISFSHDTTMISNLFAWSMFAFVTYHICSECTPRHAKWVSVMTHWLNTAMLYAVKRNRKVVSNLLANSEITKNKTYSAYGMHIMNILETRLPQNIIICLSYMYNIPLLYPSTSYKLLQTSNDVQQIQFQTSNQQLSSHQLRNLQNGDRAVMSNFHITVTS